MSQLPTNLDSLGTAMFSGPTPSAVTPKPPVWAARKPTPTAGAAKPTAAVVPTATTTTAVKPPAATATAASNTQTGAAPNPLASAIAARPGLGDMKVVPIAAGAAGAGASTDIKSLQTRAESSDATAIKHIVLDTAAMISGGLRLGQYGADVRYYTVRGVLNELRDKRAQAWIQSFPYKIEEREVSRADIAAVIEFATLTGDVHVLSQTDLSVLALTRSIEREQHGTTRIRAKPLKKQSYTGPDREKPKPVVSATAGAAVAAELSQKRLNLFVLDDLLFLTPKQFEEKNPIRAPVTPAIVSAEEKVAASDFGTPKSSTGSGSGSGGGGGGSGSGIEISDVKVASNTAPPQPPPPPAAAAAAAATATTADGDDGEGAWITPENMHLTNTFATAVEDESALSSVACVTTDYAMQNVLLQSGLRLLSINGMAIHSIRHFLKQCIACYTYTGDLAREYCAKCGNYTLCRISMMVDSKGVAHYRPPSKRALNPRGTKYSIPAPKGGRNNRDLILSEDANPHFARHNFRKAQAIANKHKTAEAEGNAADAFGSGAWLGLGAKPVVKSSYQTTERVAHGYGRTNPNAVKRSTGNRKKKK